MQSSKILKKLRSVRKLLKWHIALKIVEYPKLSESSSKIEKIHKASKISESSKSVRKLLKISEIFENDGKTP